jgi:anti-anti-sigma factor
LDSTLTVQVTYDGGVTRLIAHGEIDASSANTFEAAANQALAEAPQAIEIDLAEVGFIDSSGLRAIIALSNRSREQRVAISVTGLSAAARRVLEITGLIDTLRRS